MRYVRFVVWGIVFTYSAAAQLQIPAQSPQSARQALIEMFLGSGSDAFTKHLPKLMSQVLIRRGEGLGNPIVQKFSEIGRQMTAAGHVETFDEGSLLLVSEQNEDEAKTRTEVTVEHDYLLGENDEIELSIHVYRKGQLLFLPVVPSITFTMTQENEVWKLSDVVLTARVPLTDPEYLDGVREKENEIDERGAKARIEVILSAEMAFAAQHPDRGFTCNLRDLFGKGMATAPTNEYSANPAWAANDSNGYHFSLIGCSGSPASMFQLTGQPFDTDSGMKTFCADESGTMRFVTSGNSSDCLTQGQLVNAP